MSQSPENHSLDPAGRAHFRPQRASPTQVELPNFQFPQAAVAPPNPGFTAEQGREGAPDRPTTPTDRTPKTRPRGAEGRGYLFPGPPFSLHFPLQALGPLLRVVGLLLQHLDLALHRLDRRDPGHGCFLAAPDRPRSALPSQPRPERLLLHPLPPAPP